MKFRAALGFFTRLPVGSAPLPPTFQGVIVWLPAIGLIVGLLAALAQKQAGLDAGLLLFLKVGLCGGFTTFSTFALEAQDLLCSCPPSSAGSSGASSGSS